MIAIIDKNNDISSDIQNNEKQMTNNTEVCIEDNEVNDSLLLNTFIQNNENIIIKVIKTENRDNYNESEDKDSHKDIEITGIALVLMLNIFFN